MIVKTRIENDLKRLNRLYAASMTGRRADVPLYYAKLAVLELAGWIEESFDDIARRSLKGQLASAKFHQLLENAIDHNHGFSYDGNFLKMMAQLIGLPECERLHSLLDSDGTLSVLKAELEALLTQRRTAAHVNLANTKLAFDAPSVSLGRLARIYPILRRIYRQFC